MPIGRQQVLAGLNAFLQGVAKWILAPAAAIVVLIILLRVVIWVAVWVLPPTLLPNAITYYYPMADAYPESRSAREDHSYIDSWTGTCRRLDDPTYAGIDNSWDPPSVLAGNLIQLRLIQLSRSIASQRVELGLSAAQSYFYLQVATILTIAIGLLTSVFVVLSSTELLAKSTHLPKIKMVAMILPLLGTAVAAGVAFYGPATSYSQSRQAVASLAILHHQVSLGAARLGCPKDPASEAWKAAAATLDKWEEQYANLLGTLAPKEGSGDGKQQGDAPAGGKPPG